MKGDLGEMMKQAQKMQEGLQKAQEEIANMEVTGEAGAGLVKVSMTGRHDLKRVEIDASLMSDDKEMLEDLILSAMNEALDKSRELASKRLGAITGGMKIPGLM